MVDVKGYNVDAKGYMVDVKGYNVNGKGYMVDVKGCCVDAKDYMMDINKSLKTCFTGNNRKIGDFLVLLLREVAAQRREHPTLPPLKIVLMSATIDTRAPPPWPALLTRDPLLRPPRSSSRTISGAAPLRWRRAAPSPLSSTSSRTSTTRC
eukprot:232875-Prorocentrum_minimum.AAC.1